MQKITEETASMAPSEASTRLQTYEAFDRNAVPTGITGKPILQPTHEAYTPLLVGDGMGGFTAGAAGAAGANLLPHRYTDSSLVTIPIPVKDFEDGADKDQGEGPIKGFEHPKNKSFFRRLSSDHKKDQRKDVVAVKMSREEYLSFWAKDESGKYKADVVEPPGGRKDWVQQRLATQGEFAKGGAVR